MTYNPEPIVWNIAGSDSFGAAGTQNDLKTITMHSCHTCQVITAVTAQTMLKCVSVYPIPSNQLKAQITALKKGPPPKAIKIGMIGSQQNFNILTSELSSMSIPTVLDPVQNASEGHYLAGDIVPQDYFNFCKATRVFLTPNVHEAAWLSGTKIESSNDIVTAAKYLLGKGAFQVLIKGGHFDASSSITDGLAIDFYCDRDDLCFYIKSPRKKLNLRGTGCTLASALAANLAHGHEPPDAVVLAKAYLNQCLAIPSSIVEGDLSIAKHRPLSHTPNIFPEIEIGETLSNHTFDKSPDHRTGFYGIVDSSTWVSNLVEWNTPTIQLRIKNSNDDHLNSEIANSIAIAKSSNSKLYINDYWQQAIDQKSFGVHLGQEDLATANVHAIKKAGLRLGISTHSWFEAAVAHYYKPSYIALGPVLPTTCKSMRYGPQGFTKLKHWKNSWPYPVVAIGGLKLEHAKKLKSCSVGGVGVVSDITEAADPCSQVRAWLNVLDNREGL